MQKTILTTAFLIVVLACVRPVEGSKPVELTLFYAQLTDDDFIEIPFSIPKFKKRYLLAGP